MVAERERVDGLGKTPAHPKVSLSRPTATREGREAHTKSALRRENSDVVLQNGPSKPTDNVGQQAKDNQRSKGCQYV